MFPDESNSVVEVSKLTEASTSCDKTDADRPIEERQSPDGQEEPESDSNTSVKANGKFFISNYFYFGLLMFLHLDKKSPTTEENQGEDVRDNVPSSNILPWYARKERSILTPTSIQVETSLKPGEYVMRNLFAEFVIQADKKITSVMAESFVSTKFVYKIVSLILMFLFALFCLGSFLVKIFTERGGFSV